MRKHIYEVIFIFIIFHQTKKKEAKAIEINGGTSINYKEFGE